MYSYLWHGRRTRSTFDNIFVRVLVESKNIFLGYILHYDILSHTYYTLCFVCVISCTQSWHQLSPIIIIVCWIWNVTDIQLIRFNISRFWVFSFFSIQLQKKKKHRIGGKSKFTKKLHITPLTSKTHSSLLFT